MNDERITREEFGLAVAAFLTAEQRAEIARLHSLLCKDYEGWVDGCAASSHSDTCCMDEVLIASSDERSGA